MGGQVIEEKNTHSLLRLPSLFVLRKMVGGRLVLIIVLLD